MSRTSDILLTDLRYLIADLGRDGGQIGPSIYDTAQVLRLSPPAEGIWPAIAWLLGQQRADGGWGSPAMPLARDVPTLAAILALRTHEARKEAREAIQSGLTFLRVQSSLWSGTLPNNIPVATELILPRLLNDAAQAGLAIPPLAAYGPLRALGERRSRLIAQLHPGAGTTASHSWETWGQQPSTALIDESGSVGHSPTATAAWVAASADRPDLALQRAAAQRFLASAAQATGLDIPGVVPSVWPYPRNEQTVSLFVLMLAGLLDDPTLREPLDAQIDDIWRGLRPDGQGISDLFTSDGDITAMSFATVAQRGYKPDLAVLRRFISGGTCLTYRQEMQHSLSATAHAAHTLAMLGGDPTPLLDYLCLQRSTEGFWTGDKWHASWTYITGHTISALLAANRYEEARMALPALLDRQHHDGSWGTTEASDEETANITLAMLDMDRHGLLHPEAQLALTRASRWLQAHYSPLREHNGACWIGKELYRPRRIARVLHLSALIGCVRNGYL